MSKFRRRLGQLESQGSGGYSAENDEGYVGKYQFGDARLADFMSATGKQFTMADFKGNQKLQEEVQAWHEGDIMSYVSNKGLGKYVGQDVGGVTITPDGLLSMAHLGGKSGMRKFLESGGEYNPSDSKGTSLSDYAREFAPVRPSSRPDTVGGIEAALKTLAESDGGSEADDYESAMAGLSMLTKAFSPRKVSPLKATSSVSRGSGGGNALDRFEGLASLRRG
tara:strand:+ start:766 stop:1434 length:669 start_codon:yes stop_codon:yes gene_type:complete